MPEDLEWFENEECEGTRVRTVEPYEAEWAQMLRKEVVGVENSCAALPPSRLAAARRLSHTTRVTPTGICMAHAAHARTHTHP